MCKHNAWSYVNLKPIYRHTPAYFDNELVGCVLWDGVHHDYGGESHV